MLSDVLQKIVRDTKRDIAIIGTGTADVYKRLLEIVPEDKHVAMYTCFNKNEEIIPVSKEGVIPCEVTEGTKVDVLVINSSIGTLSETKRLREVTNTIWLVNQTKYYRYSALMTEASKLHMNGFVVLIVEDGDIVKNMF